jgi:hypothetical protein
VADVLRAEGHAAIVPELSSPPNIEGTYWERHVAAVADAVRDLEPAMPLILAAHSGAGPLLPAIGHTLDATVARYVFADAALPAAGRSRLEAFTDPDAADAFRRNTVDGLVQPWPDAALVPLIPDDTVRAAFVADLQPMPLAVYAEPLPAVPGWPDAPCSYVRFSDVYGKEFAQAIRLGWQVRQFAAGHFHMLEDPRGVARALLDIAAETAP